MQNLTSRSYFSLSNFIDNAGINKKMANINGYKEGHNEKYKEGYNELNGVITTSNSDLEPLFPGSDCPTIIFHIDLDCFFAAVEARDNPEYKGKPLIIGADPKGGKGRGVISTCSYEARRFGLHSAMPISQAYKLCPNGIYIRGNHSKYSVASKQVMEILKSYMDGTLITKTSQRQKSPTATNSNKIVKIRALNFLQASIDEAYLDFSHQDFSFKDAHKLAHQIKEHIKNEVGITCSIGVGPTKAIAKIASDHNKPDGITVVEPAGIRLFLENLEITRISGIGKKSGRYYNEKGIKYIRDFYKLGRDGLFYNFGQHGLWIWDVITGRSSGLVIGYHERKSIGKERTFSRDVNDLSILNAKLYELNKRLHESMSEKKLMYKTITLKIRFRGFETYTRSYTFVHPSFDETRAYKQLLLLMRDFYANCNSNSNSNRNNNNNNNMAHAGKNINRNDAHKLKKQVRLIGVRFTGLQHLVKKKATQATLNNYI